MSTVFADTFYFLGLLNRADEAHPCCKQFAAGFRGRLLTTDYVILELADGLASPSHRLRTAHFIRTLRMTPSIEVVSASEILLTQALELYQSRPDKEWSLTDCTSFAVMQERGVSDAATGDRHFEQAGYKALLLPNGATI